MMRLAPSMGRERTHDLVYRAASEARQNEHVTTEEEKLQKQDARGHGKQTRLFMNREYRCFEKETIV